MVSPAQTLCSSGDALFFGQVMCAAPDVPAHAQRAVMQWEMACKPGAQELLTPVHRMPRPPAPGPASGSAGPQPSQSLLEPSDFRVLEHVFAAVRTPHAEQCSHTRVYKSGGGQHPSEGPQSLESARPGAAGWRRRTAPCDRLAIHSCCQLTGLALAWLVNQAELAAFTRVLISRVFSTFFILFGSLCMYKAFPWVLQQQATFHSCHGRRNMQEGA